MRPSMFPTTEVKKLNISMPVIMSEPLTNLSFVNSSLNMFINNILQHYE